MIRDYALSLQNEPVIVPDSFLPPPVLTFSQQSRKWMLENPYFYLGEGFNLTVPAGYAFDLASVPRAIWWAIAPFELSIVAPLIHDFMYDYGGVLLRQAVQPYRTFTRRHADHLFLEIMRREGVPELKARIAFNAVRAAGWIGWKGREEPDDENSLQFMSV
ncbi:DUF1353 domain-containing protein [Rufibacter tibetensis]|uniref:DUF1353 domain-containing protein n=1 Tax=Rufibacter tibetensis TaxID=512763 RepID=A0A0P0CM76_9BACT|nr:DUF1353 domain-containing protein [Rufibacter tibetensis]ALJ00803.1 hypothetical protein DC20_19715 [Rufibacter tibetensis]